jgi:hypothetical protein
MADDKNTLKVGDFLRHKNNEQIVFQVVAIYDCVDGLGNDASRMVICHPIRNLTAYSESDVSKYALTVEDKDDIWEHHGL